MYPKMNNKNTIIELQYLPCVDYFLQMLIADNVCIDIHEHYQKQTFRNRATILTSQGKLDLSIPIRKYAPKTPTKDILIDHSQRWAVIHWRTLATAYRKSPFFEYYADTLEKIYTEKTDFLADFNKKLLTFCLNALKIKTNYFFSEKYFDTKTTNEFLLENPISSLETMIFTDFRGKIGSNKSVLFPQKEYLQVFGNAFEKNLSVVDLLFCEGIITQPPKEE